MFVERAWLMRNPILWVVVPLIGAVLVVAVLGGAPWPVAILPGLLLVLLCFSRLTVRVEGDALQLTYFPFWRRTIALSAVASAEVVPYKWVKFGGWGIRVGFDGSISYSVWEKECVRLTIAGKRPVNIGSRRPEELRRAILGHRRPKPS